MEVALSVLVTVLLRRCCVSLRLRTLISIMAAAALVPLATIALSERANACATTGTFADLVAAGSCVFVGSNGGADKIFSNFTYTPSETGGAVTLPATSFFYTTTLAPSGLVSGLDFLFSLTANSGQINNIALGYSVAVIVDAALIRGGTLGPMTADVTGTGSASVSETYCLLAFTTVGCPSADLGHLGTSFPAPLIDSVATPGENCAEGTSCPFFNMGALTFAEEITATGGSDGTAAVTTLTNTVDQVVPEPASLALLTVNLLGLGAYRRLRV
jgi:hypothetical protein